MDPATVDQQAGYGSPGSTLAAQSQGGPTIRNIPPPTRRRAAPEAGSTGSGAQKFWFASNGGSWFAVANLNAPGQVWDVTGASTANGAPIQLWSWLGGNNQQWTPVPEGNGYYHFVSRNSGLCLDVPGASTASGVQLQQYGCDGTGAQSFRLA